jgi:hypothetical protein
MYDVNENILVCIEWHGVPPLYEPPPFARLVSLSTVVPPERYHAWDCDYLRHINPGKGPLYLSGVVLCRRLDRRTPVDAAALLGGSYVYCVHIPEVPAEKSPNNKSLSLLELGKTTKESPLALTGCPRHDPLTDMACRACFCDMKYHGPKGTTPSQDPDAARWFMLGLGYVCTISARGP